MTFLHSARSQLQKMISGTTYTSSYSYNLASELASLTYPSTRVLQQSYDAIWPPVRDLACAGACSCWAA